MASGLVRYPLPRCEQFCKGKAPEPLLGEGGKAEDWNDDRRGPGDNTNRLKSNEVEKISSKHGK